MKNIACFDIGGTFIKFGIVNEAGTILYKNKYPTQNQECRRTIPLSVVKRIEELNRNYNIDCVGISTAGQVDSQNGVITFASDNIPDYTGTRLSKEIFKQTGLECHIENDVNCAALGELWKGEIGDSNSLFFLTLGTGIGGAIIIDGKLYKGKGSAGEAGHMIINENARENICTCGGTGCFETYGSVTSLIKSYCRESGYSHDSINGEKIMQLVESGDTCAVRIYDEFIYHLVTGLLGITYVLDPGLIVIGGGISENDRLLLDINKEYKKRAMPSYAAHTKIISSSLKNDAGLIGACYVGLKY